MIVCLTPKKQLSLKTNCTSMGNRRKVTIREFANVIRKIMSSLPNTMHLPLQYRRLGKKILALKDNKENFDAVMTFLPAAKDELICLENCDICYNVISQGQQDMVITTEASHMGWGAWTEKASAKSPVETSAWGPGYKIESDDHINILEMLAAFLSLKTFAKSR